jgi:hypothetical protein
MNPQFEGALRSLIIALGSVAGALGYAAGADWVSIASGLVAVAGLGWSLWSNRPKGLIQQAAQSSHVQEIVVSTPELANSIPSDKVVAL